MFLAHRKALREIPHGCRGQSGLTRSEASRNARQQMGTKKHTSSCLVARCRRIEFLAVPSLCVNQNEHRSTRYVPRQDPQESWFIRPNNGPRLHTFSSARRSAPTRRPNNCGQSSPIALAARMSPLFPCSGLGVPYSLRPIHELIKAQLRRFR
jgi:hypothetical protein